MENRIKIREGLYYDVPDKKNIETLYVGLPKSQQYWRREDDFPSFFYDYDPHAPEKVRCGINKAKTRYAGNKLVTLSSEDTVELIRLANREHNRMTNGIYIMNYGEKIYLPGFFYGVLQWVKMFGVPGDGYGEHREYQRIFAYVHEMAVNNPEYWGYYNHKAKKTGITQLVAAINLIELITSEQFIVTAMSKVHDTAKKSNFKYFMHGLKNLPPILRPYIENTKWKSSVQTIDFKSSKTDESLDSTYAVVPTTTDGLDGYPIIKRIHLDEPPKFPSNVPIEQVFEKSKEQVKQQHVKHGIIQMTSYPPEEDTDAFAWCKKFYNEMCAIKDGKPLNGIIPFFIGVLESSAGTFDKYGKPNKEKAFAEETAARALCKTSYELQARKRQYPMTEEEGWESSGEGKAYDGILLGGIKNNLEKEYSFGNLNYIEGDLEWTDGFLSPVRFVPTTFEEKKKGKDGKWKIYCPLKSLEGKTNLCFDTPKRISYRDGQRHYLLQPPEYTDFVGATDPVDYAETKETSGRLSKTASITKNLMGDMISVYHYRADNPDNDIDNICKEMVFFNKFNLVEGNRKNVYTTLVKMGLANFLLVRHPNGEILPYKEKVSVRPVASTGDVISKYVSLVIKRYKTTPEYLKSLDVVNQHILFDAAKTQKFDLSVADGLSEIALEAFVVWLRIRKSRENVYGSLGDVLSKIM